jgi:DnaJ family protein C protein 19
MLKWLLFLAIVYAVWRFLRPAPARKPSPLADARALLGVTHNADEAAIRAAHRRLIAEIHPDRGGSPERARQANAARDTLLARLRRD